MDQVNVLFKAEIDALNLNMMYVARNNALIWIQLGLFHLLYNRFLDVIHIQKPLFSSHFGANVIYTLCFGFKLSVKGKIMSVALFQETRAERISV